MTPTMERYVARQPILDARLNVVAYELLFRRGREATSAGVVDYDASTSETVLTSLSDIGLDALVGARTAFLNVPRTFLLEGHVQLCPPERVTLEVLESVVVDEPVVAAVRSCAAAGYRIALDDFVHRAELEPLLRIASIVKLDALALGLDGVAEQIALARPYGVTLLAEKVESHDVYQRCLELGCTLFQGYFFSRPATVGARSIPASRMSRVRLIASLNDPAVQPGELASIIRGDPGLSLRLLRYVNSAFIGLPRTVGSIQEALVLIGYRKLRSLATLIAFASVNESPPELLVTGLVRARMCELLAPVVGVESDEAFTVGLFSVIDALMDASMEQILAEVPLPAATSAALLGRDGDLGRLLEVMFAYESSALELLPPETALELAELQQAYVEALGWADASAVAAAA